LETNELTLSPCTLQHVEQLIAGPADFERAFGLRVIDGYLEEASHDALYYWRNQLNEQQTPDCWGTYLFIHRADKALIGLGGYKGAPNDDGAVEIGYGVAPAYQGRGYATEAARAMVEAAFADPAVRTVMAHTLPHENPSTSVLKKLGMVNVGEYHDPEEGAVWRWQIARSEA
jgi:[ribosomal protein S5]-alanine N-acetyltransferase